MYGRPWPVSREASVAVCCWQQKCHHHVSLYITRGSIVHLENGFRRCIGIRLVWADCEGFKLKGDLQDVVYVTHVKRFTSDRNTTLTTVIVGECGACRSYKLKYSGAPPTFLLLLVNFSVRNQSYRLMRKMHNVVDEKTITVIGRYK